MSQFSSEDEAELQYLLRQLLKSTKDRISGAPSIECAEEILDCLSGIYHVNSEWDTCLLRTDLIYANICYVCHV
jgi:hypothetical protein